MGSKTHRNALKPGHKILWYEIKEILGQGGFGITYLAYDPNLDKNVAIKEYLPIEIAVREGNFSVHPVTEDYDKKYSWGLERFISEARTLAKFEHPNVVRVLSVTEENNTAYMVMAYEEGQSLKEKLQGRKTLEETEILKILFPILSGLEIVHKAGFIHRDIKPDNIFIRKDGSPVLLDFGSARQALGEETKTLTSLVSPGYAPFEQYFSKSDKQGAYTDIYGLGATLYRAIAGIAPQDATDRSYALINNSSHTNVSAVEIGQSEYSNRFLNAIDHAIQFKSEDRPQTISEWKKEFELPDDPIEETEVIEESITESGETILARQQDKKKFTLPISLSIILVFLLSFIFSQLRTNKPPEALNAVIVEVQEINNPVIQQQDEAKKQNALAREKAVIEQDKQNAADKKREVERQKENKIQTLLSDAQEDIELLRLSSPKGNNALEKYNQILKLSPSNSEAKQGLENIVGKYIALAKQAASSEEYDKSIIRLDKAERVIPNAMNIQYAREEIESGKTKKEQQKAEEENRLVELERQRKAQELQRKTTLEKKKLDAEKMQAKKEDEYKSKKSTKMTAMEEVAQRLQNDGQHYKAWVFDADTGCGIWSAILSNTYGHSYAVLWSGGCVDGMASGEGTLRLYVDSKKAGYIKATFREGLVNGYATKAIYAEGDREAEGYKGEFKDSKPDGRGEEIINTAISYKGEWKNGKKHGKGTDGDPDLPVYNQYEGEWKNNERNGYGVVKNTIFNIIIKEGQWKDNKFIGRY